MRPHNITKEELERLYNKKMMSLREIAEYLGVSKRTVLRLMKKYDIPRRSISEGNFLYYKKHIKILPKENKPFSKEVVYDLYWHKGYSTRDIAKAFGTNHRRVLSYMNKWGIPRREGVSNIQPPKINMNLNNTTLAYIAGIIDGEGTISENYVAVGNTCLNLIKKLSEWFNTKVIKSKTPAGKNFYVVRISSKYDIYLLLKAITPYLIVKRDKAERIVQSLSKIIDGAEV